ncbi:EpsG family protein [Urechidicola croceus]|uniref:EpsG family protein n=1 Tax=Urechidicola croceus TaxID=1850246 RepID=A0A1D8P6B9_9FLAO|nr:EpsG family protein [Urechidicola croceus]AOW20102.1 hypothetical protein LPB138_05140 [Urechidicola croceus]
MRYIFENLVVGDYGLINKIVLGFYILFSTFILKLLIGQKERFRRNDRNILITYILFLMFFVGTRGHKIGVDTSNYYSYFWIPATQVESFFGIFWRLNTDFLFEVLIALTSWTNEYTFFLLAEAILINIVFYVFVRKFTNYGKDGSSLILFLTLASSFSFLNLEINIMRNALAISFILIAIHYALEDEIKKCLLFFLVAYMFHRTTVIPFALILAILATKNMHIKYYLMFYVLAIGASAAGFGFHRISFLAEIGGEDLQSLSFDGETNYRIGFRPDFVGYNTFFLALFMKFSSKNPRDLFLIKYYILSSAIFFFNFYIPFSDRFGVYSWVIIPLLLYNTINESFPDRKVYISTLVLISFFMMNKIILFP